MPLIEYLLVCQDMKRKLFFLTVQLCTRSKQYKAKKQKKLYRELDAWKVIYTFLFHLR